jgi:hypothetical protein
MDLLLIFRVTIVGHFTMKSYPSLWGWEITISTVTMTQPNSRIVISSLSLRLHMKCAKAQKIRQGILNKIVAKGQKLKEKKT